MGGIGAIGAVRDRLNEFAAVRADTLSRIAPLSQPQLDFSPRRGRWSIGEIADHLRLSELLWRDELSRLIALARAGKPAVVKHSFAEIDVSPLHLPTPILSMIETPLSFMNRFVPDAVIGMITEFPILPTRNPGVATPRARRARFELLDDLGSSLEQTRRLIDANADLDFGRMISEHPLMGSNNAPQILSFLARHERRHHSQMRGVNSDPKFPRS